MVERSTEKPGISEPIHRARKGYLLAGGLMMLGGALAVVFPFFGTLATTIFVGWVLIMSGAVEILHALSVRGAPAIVLNLLAGLLSLAVGALVLYDPFAGAFSLTLLLAGFLAADGVIRILSAAQVGRVPGQGWILVNGVSSLLLAAILLWALPQASLYVLGILLGIDLLVAGGTLILLAQVARAIEEALEGR
jgi:uncharacterized membrane protein HdeD (DUF308 family)